MSDGQPSPLPVPLDQLAPEVLRVVGPEAPAPMRMMAARALSPLRPGHLLTALFVLCYDSESGIAAAAQESIGRLPDEILRPALAEPLPPAVVDYLARALANSPEHLEVVALNRTLPDETAAWLAQGRQARVLEIIANNQQRLLRHPAIIEALYLNRATPPSIVDRVMELAVRNGLRLTAIPAYRELAAALGYALTAEDTQDAAETRAELEAAAALKQAAAAQAPGPGAAPSTLTGLEPLPEAEEEGLPAWVLELGFGEAGGDAPAPPAAGFRGGVDPEAGTGYSDDEFLALLEDPNRVEPAPDRKQSSDDADSKPGGKTDYVKLSASQKVRLAVLGNGEDRAHLVRDPKRLVAMAAIKSPKVNVSEVEQYAANASIHGDVVRYIAGNREWTRSYRVKQALILNPKCPLHDSIAFIKYLRAGDLKSIAVNKNVPEAVGAAARAMMRARQGDKG